MAGPSAGLGNLVSTSDVISALRRHLGMIICLFIVVSGAGIALTLYLWIAKPVYEAEARIEVRPGYTGSRVGGVETRADVMPPSQIEPFINGQVSLVKSDSVLRMALNPAIYKRIISDLDPADERIILGGSGPAAVRDANTELQRRTERIAKNIHLLLGSSEAKVAKLKKKISVRNPYRTMYITISLAGRDRQLITDVVNNIVESYMLAYRIARKQREITRMRGLKKQRDELRGPLERAEDRLNELRKRVDAISLGGDRLDVAGELRFYEQERAKVGLQLVALQLLERQLLPAPDAEENELPLKAKPTPEMELIMQGDAMLGRLKAGLAALMREKGVLAGQGYGPGHRMVIASESQIKRTEEEIKARRTELTDILIRRQTEEIKGNLTSVTEQYREINQRYDKARATAQELVEQAVAYERLNRVYESLKNHMSMINQAIIQQTIQSEIAANSVRIWEPATRPEADDKAGPSLILYIPGCMVLGLIISIGLALLVELIDNRVRTPLQVIRNIQMTVLGTVPDRKEDAATRRLDDLSLVTTQAPQSLMAESFRQLRTALLYSTDTELKTLLVTSPRAGEGKSTVASNLAITLAASGCRVLLVDTNFRQPMVHRAFDLPNSIGLSSVLARLNSFDEATQSTTIANLDCLCCGPVPPSPADLLGSEAMQNLLAEAQQRYDNVILDGTPMLVVTDSHVLCSMVDGVAMVISCSQTPRGVALRTKRMLLGCRARLVGAVLNRVRAQKGGYFREAYKSYYDYAGGAAAPAAPQLATSRSSDAASAMDSLVDLSGRDEGDDTEQNQSS